MRRLLLLLVLLAAPLPAYGAPSGSYVDLVAAGPAYGTFTLPHSLYLDFARAEVVRGSTPYAVLVVTDTRGIVAVGGVTPDPGQHHYAMRVPSGRMTFRLLTRGATTLRVPVDRGRSTFRLTKRLNGSQAVVRTPAVTGLNVVEDRIPLTVKVPSAVFHGFVAETTTGAFPTKLCVVPDENTVCQSTQMSGGNYWYLASAPREGGRQYAKVTATAVGLFGEDRTHWAFVIPVG